MTSVKSDHLSRRERALVFGLLVWIATALVLATIAVANANRANDLQYQLDFLATYL